MCDVCAYEKLTSLVGTEAGLLGEGIMSTVSTSYLARPPLSLRSTSPKTDLFRFRVGA